MALSEREQKLLEELERGLYAEDAEFANRVAKNAAPSIRRMVGGAALALIGISVLLFAVIIQIAAFGVAGFLIMLAGLILASSNFKQSPTKPAKPSAGRPAGGPIPPTKPSTNPFEDRWDRRRGL